jgi:hypothetical protein
MFGGTLIYVLYRLVTFWFPEKSGNPAGDKFLSLHVDTISRRQGNSKYLFVETWKSSICT